MNCPHGNRAKSHCSQCRRERKRAWDAKNREHVLEHQKAYNKAKYAKNPAAVKARVQAWRKANPEKKLEQDRLYRARHPEKVTQKNHRQLAKRHHVSGTFTADEWIAIKQRYDLRCLACGRREPEIKLTPDHVKALSEGGENTAQNIQPLCQPCNARKGKKHIDYRMVTP